MAGREKVRIGVIGVGSMGQGHCASVQQVRGAVLTAACDIDPEALEAVSKRWEVPTFPTARALIRSQTCDAVIIATPHPVRPAIAIECMKAGLHVLSEKPLAERVSAADRMIRTADKTGVAFAVMFQRRTESIWRKARAFVEQGKLGPLIRATLTLPDYRTQAYYDSGSWRATWRGEGGGVLLNQAPHILDLFLLLAGQPATVTGHVATAGHRIEVEDTAQAMLTFNDGATGYVYCTTNEPRPGERMELVGQQGKCVYEDGQLRWFSYKPPIDQLTRETEKMWTQPTVAERSLRIADRPSGHQVVIANFVDHIRKGTELIAPGREGLASLELANAIVLSSYLNKAMKLPLSRRRYDAFLAEKREASPKFAKSGLSRRETDPQHLVRNKR